jgi:hypothetical protein
LYKKITKDLLDNREFVLVEGRHPSFDPNHGQDDASYDSEEEGRDLHHQDMYMNRGRNHHFGPPRPPPAQCNPPAE